MAVRLRRLGAIFVLGLGLPIGVAVLPSTAIANGGNTLFVDQDVPVGDGSSCASPGFTDIQSAIATSASGDTIRICGSPNPYLPPGVMDTETKILTFVGDGPAETVIDGRGDHALIAGGESLTFESMAFQSGFDINSGGAIESRTGTLTVRDVVFRNNSSVGFGDGGGAIRADDVVVEDSEFIGNVADHLPEYGALPAAGGAIYADGSVTVRGSDFRFNGAPGTAGEGNGGAIYALSVEVYDSTFDTNDALTSGGAIYSRSTTRVTRSHFMRNLTDVQSGGTGGAVFSIGAVTAYASSFSGGSASIGAAIDSGSAATGLDRSTISDNAGYGAVAAGDITALNSTITDNSGGPALVAAKFPSDGQITLLSTTVARNAPFASDPGVISALGSIAIGNSIIDEDPAEGASACDSPGSNNFGGNVVADSAVGCDGFALPLVVCGGDKEGEVHGCANPGIPVPSEQIGLRELGDYGGPTETIRLAPDSVALGAGVAADCPPEDQRGVDRTGGCDSGAFQLTEWTVEVQDAGTGTGTVTSDPAGIECPEMDCSARYPESSQVTLTAVADEGSTFTGWDGACVGTGTCVLDMDASRTVRAEFTAVPERDLTVETGGTGAGTVTSDPVGIDCGEQCSGSFTDGTEVTLAALPEEGSNFTGWSGACSGAGECVVEMDQARFVRAEFTAVPDWLLTLETGGTGAGTVTSDPVGIDCGEACAVSFTDGTEVTLTAAPGADSTFTGWSGACSGAGECVVEMDQARFVRAEFGTVRNSTKPRLGMAGRATVRSIPVEVSCGGPSPCRLRVTGYLRGRKGTQASPKLVTLLTVSAGQRRRVEVLKSNRTADPATRRKVQRKIRRAKRPVFDVTALDVTTGRQSRLKVAITSTRNDS